MRAIQDERVTEDLRDLCFRLGGDQLGDLVTIHPGVLADLDLDELVIEQRLVDSGHEAVIDAVLADLHDRAQVVGEGTKMATLLTAEHGAV